MATSSLTERKIPESSRLLSSDDVADMLGIDARGRCVAWRSRGTSSLASRLGHRTIRFRLADVLAFIEANTKNNEERPAPNRTLSNTRPGRADVNHGNCTSGAGLALQLPPELLEEISRRAADLLADRVTQVRSYLTPAEAADYLRCSKQRIYGPHERRPSCPCARTAAATCTAAPTSTATWPGRPESPKRDRVHMTAPGHAESRALDGNAAAGTSPRKLEPGGAFVLDAPDGVPGDLG